MLCCCNNFYDRYAFARVEGMASLGLNLVAINAVATFVACCLCFKRRDEDVLPPEYTKAMAGVWLEESRRGVSHTEAPYLVEARFTKEFAAV